MKSVKEKIYHKLINNEISYNTRSIRRYKKNNTKIIGNSKKDKIPQLEKLKKQINSIKNCDLKKNATNLVFADGNPSSSIMIIGEGPGANEDKEGKPFVGRAGKLLDKMLEAIKLNRRNVYISNVVNFRPPMNRRPTDIEINRYLPFLNKHIEIINPKILLLLGSTALNALIGNEVVISKARGKWVTKKIGNANPEVIASFHPAFLMRQPDQKKYAWEDLKMIKKKMSELKIKLNA
ncbi:MAG: uracil-DNA glycosylase [Candidatus Marinimicrobia bacterium]|nr:uracil-DNA glycosylase [Candidatus Neomarinimicrobiota bacterium]RPG05408.1 MAG: uracil-DNA glycosylase [Pelagibacteraceae bacterium TMED247]|tara:strand:+ start:4423 stop:5130 length:708 start_codon:yes stop_codon:yes gene_type:complete